MRTTYRKLPEWFIWPAIALIILLAGAMFESEVAVQISAPATVTAGDEFEVQVTLKKGSVSSFSRLLQELPGGLKAKSISSVNADFTFKDNKVRMIWLKMPDEDEVIVKYSIKVDQRLKGTFDLAGRFSYIEDNERKSIEAAPYSITINPNPTIDPSLIVDIKDFSEKVIPDLTPTGTPLVACIRQKPQATGEADGSYIVNVLVNKQNAQKFAKIEEDVPETFSAIKVSEKEALFSNREGLAKFIWMNLPSDPYFIVTYKLIPRTKTAGEPQLTGRFSYVVDDKTTTIDIVEKDMNLTALSAEEINKLVAEVLAKPVPVMPMVAMADTTRKDTLTAIPVKEEVAKIEKPKPVKKSLLSRIFKKKEDISAYLLQPEQGVYYRVQVAAGHKPINIRRYFKRLKVKDDIKAEEHEGWRKYSIGSFYEYKQARDYRVHIWNTTPITDAFVSAYNNGKRITVQEALMITNQSWYR